MKVTRKHFDEAVENKIISSEQSESLISFFQSHPKTSPSFDFTHLLYYSGGLLAIGAMTLFMNLGWEMFGGAGILTMSLLYAYIGVRLTQHFQTKKFHIPAGICATFVVAISPLAIYGLQQALGFWPDDNSAYRDYHRYIKWHWIYMELGTLVTGLAMIRIFKYPFLTMPIAITLWYLSMDVARFIINDYLHWELRAFITMVIGLVVTYATFHVDLRSHKHGDYAFWLYIFGVMAFWGGLTSQSSDNELGKFVYFCINLLMILIGITIVRRVFVIFGAMGSFIYLMHLSSSVFENSLMFPIVLTLIGLGIIYLGVFWQKNEKELTAKIRSKLPDKLQSLLIERDCQ